jgi:methyl-accepting chemotaxis protein
MKIRFTIARKLLVGFGIVTMAVIISSSLTFLTLQKNKQINEEVSKTLSPSENYLNELTALVVNSKMLIKNWVFIERKNDTPDKIKLRKLHNESFPDLEEKILVLEKSWSTNDQKEINNLLSAINDTLFEYHRTIMDQLSSFEAYDDVMIVFEVNPMVQEDRF